MGETLSPNLEPAGSIRQGWPASSSLRASVLASLGLGLQSTAVLAQVLRVELDHHASMNHLSGPWAHSSALMFAEGQITFIVPLPSCVLE